MYSKEGIPAGLNEVVIVDEDLDPWDVLEEETAGVEPHLAVMMNLEMTLQFQKSFSRQWACLILKGIKYQVGRSKHLRFETFYPKIWSYQTLSLHEVHKPFWNTRILTCSWGCFQHCSLMMWEVSRTHTEWSNYCSRNKQSIIWIWSNDVSSIISTTHLSC